MYLTVDCVLFKLFDLQRDWKATKNWSTKTERHVRPFIAISLYHCNIMTFALIGLTEHTSECEKV